MEFHVIPGRGWDSNIYVFESKGEYLIVDIGTGNYHKEVIETFKKIGLHRNNVIGLVFTHTHPDHCGGVNYVVDALEVAVYVHERELNLLKNGKIEDIFNMLNKQVSPVDAKKLVSNQKITVGESTFFVYHTPGHSPGSICLYNPDEKILVCGDTVFPGGNFGRTDFKGGSSEELIKSIESLAKLDVVKLLPGHMRVLYERGAEHIKKSLKNCRLIL
jgi:glyoxylase-like metal-dependent hydrolase (beta-lactamase superfamily II)